MVEQGDIIKIEGVSPLVVVVSKNIINETGMVIVCPILKGNVLPTLAVPLDDDSYVACDTIKQVDLAARRYSHKSRVHVSKLILMIDMVQALFDFI